MKNIQDIIAKSIDETIPDKVSPFLLDPETMRYVGMAAAHWSAVEVQLQMVL